MDLSGKIGKNNIILKNLIINKDKEESKKETETLEFEKKADKKIEEFVIQKVDISSLDILADVNKGLIGLKDTKRDKLNGYIKSALANQNLILIEDDQYENERGRIVAKDSNGNYYDFDKDKKEFILRTYNGIKDSIQSGNDYFDATDLVRFINRVKENLDPLFIHGNLEPYRDSLCILDCPSDMQDSIMSELEDALIVYYAENGEVGLNNYLNEVYAELTAPLKPELQKFEERLEGDEFDREMSKDELKQIVKQYAELVINDLTSKYEYPEHYLNSLRTFITNSAFYEACYEVNNNNYSFETINAKDVLKVLEKYIHELTDTPLTECNSNNIREELNAVGFHYPFCENIAEKFINNNLLTNIYYWEYGYDNAMSIEEFYDCLTKYIAKNYGMEDELENNGYINFANLINFDANSDGNWLDDFYRIAAEFAHKNDNMNFDNVNELNVDLIFEDNDIISFTDFHDKIKEAFLSDDVSLNKIQNVLANACKKYGIDDNYDKEDLIKNIVILMNKAAEIENSYPLTISRDTIEQLNEKGIFDELDKIINSDELRDLYYFGVDGYIDDFGQGSTGDCWLLAAISALDATESGQQVIKDSISQDENGDIVVTFRGIGVSYTITPEEMVEARDAFAYSHGDNDVQALELATEKLRRDIIAGKINLRYGNDGGGNDNGSYGMGIWGGYQDYMLYYLTGNIPQTELSYPDSESDVIEFLNSIYNDFQTGNFAGYFTLGNKNVQATTTDNRTFSWIEGSYHAFSIIDMTQDTITIANPWCPNEPYTLSWDEFANLLPRNAGIVSTTVHEQGCKTTWNNTIDFDSTLSINGNEYSLNDVISSDEPIVLSINDKKEIFDIILPLLQQLENTLDDIQPQLLAKIIDTIEDFYCIFARLCFNENAYNNGTNTTIYNALTENDEYVYFDSTVAENYGITRTENGVQIDIRVLVNKLLEFVEQGINNN